MTPKVFNCDEETMKKWIINVSKFFTKHGISISARIGALKLTQSLLNNNAWNFSFTDNQKLVIYINVAFIDLQKYFTFTADARTKELLNGKRKESIPIVAALFGTGFGVSDKLEEDKAKDLLQIIDEYSIDDSINQITKVYGNIRALSSKGSSTLKQGTLFIARASIIISQLFSFTFNPQEKPD